MNKIFNRKTISLIILVGKFNGYLIWADVFHNRKRILFHRSKVKCSLKFLCDRFCFKIGIKFKIMIAICHELYDTLNVNETSRINHNITHKYQIILSIKILKLASNLSSFFKFFNSSTTNFGVLSFFRTFSTI
ncbi:hypothetical protein BpHYR1_040889 [Brachionus plicatilis]|uniref:Uncharacterized protein n=1 Tax=Brachionus plicatilis TaxID=10195 RepID=A0A3M7RS80_BRAPC|nr:hypothetical protein BpHYR1_040889 [Brachionus plicatilis]